MGRTAPLILLLTVGVSSTASCVGGCWLKADAVRTDPNTDCLALFAGHSASDPTVCGVPKLGGVNNCSVALTLPNAAVFAPGQEIEWWPHSMQSVPPAIMVNQAAAGVTNYVISATLGTQNITITIPVHD